MGENIQYQSALWHQPYPPQYGMDKQLLLSARPRNLSAIRFMSLHTEKFFPVANYHLLNLSQRETNAAWLFRYLCF